MDAGEAIFAVIGIWTPGESATGTAGQAEFLKLAGSQGWIPNLGSLKGNEWVKSFFFVFLISSALF